jgi:7-cyano-7-deazaguanine synthase
MNDGTLEQAGQCALLLSGGLDSVVSEYHLLKIFETVHTITFDYGQCTRSELARIHEHHADNPRVVRTVLALSDLYKVFGECTLTRYATTPRAVEQAEAPFRNAIFATIGAAYCQSNRISELYIGIHATGRDVYWDSEPAFISGFNMFADLTREHKVRLRTCIHAMTKAQIIEEGLRLGIDLGKTWSCFASGNVPCGECYKCIKRAEAFAELGIPDPAITTL